MTKQLVLLAGPTGVGKTSLASRIGKALDWHVGYESVLENPYLPDFYKNIQAWSFHLQVYFLGHRADQHLKAAEMPQSAILDRSIYEDAFIFAKALYDSGNLTERDYNSYISLYDFVANTLPLPNLLIYLKAPCEVRVHRIRERKHEFEDSLSKEYLEMVASYYDNWIASFDLCPILTIDTDRKEFVNNNEVVNDIINEMQYTLYPK
jgi:deoxyadenosine/deoxycytidine kinase